MLPVILLIIATCFPLYSGEVEVPLSEEEQHYIRKLSGEYIEFRRDTTIVNLRTDRSLLKLLRANNILESSTDEALKPLTWVTEQVRELKDKITSLDTQMREYEAAVYLKYPKDADINDPQTQIRAINTAARIIKNREKSRILKRWREAVQTKQRFQKLIVCLEAFYKGYEEDATPTASATAKYILEASTKLASPLHRSCRCNPRETRVRVKEFCESFYAVTGG